MNINTQGNKKDREKPYYGLVKLFNLFAISTLVLLGAQSAYAATFYVSTSGNDANDGLTTSTPVKTIKKALSKAQSSGDTVYVMTGVYSESNDIYQSGITLSAYPNNKPVIDGSALPGKDWLTLLGVVGNNNTISGFEIRNSNLNKGKSGGTGVQISGKNNTISNINSHHTWSSGILIQGDYNTVQDSSVWETGLGGNSSGLSAGRGSTTSIISHITSYPTIRRNKVFNTRGEALSCFEADHCRIEDNIVYDNQGVNLYLSDARNSIVQRNMIYISSAPAIQANTAGIVLADELSSVPRSANNTIVNNFLYKVNMSAFFWTLVPYSGLDNVVIAYNTIVDGGMYTKSSASSVPIVDKNSQIRNNITIGHDIKQITNTSGITFSNNSWYGAIPTGGVTSTDVIGDPKISKTGSTAPGAITPDFFKILDNSPVKGAAMALSIAPQDFFGTTRGSTPDMGGHQSSTSIAQPAPTPTPTGDLQFYSYSAGSVTANTANIKWSTNIPAGGILYYKVDGSSNALSVSAGKSTSQSINLTGLTANTKYKYDIWVWANGVTISTPPLYFTTTK